MLACCVKDRGSSCGRASMRLYPRASFLAYGSSARCAGRRTLSFFTVAKEENDESDEDENEDEDEDEDEELGRNKGRSAERGIVTQQSNEASPDGRFRGRWLLLTLGARYCPWLVNRHRQKKKQMQKKQVGMVMDDFIGREMEPPNKLECLAFLSSRLVAACLGVGLASSGLVPLRVGIRHLLLPFLFTRKPLLVGG